MDTNLPRTEAILPADALAGKSVFVTGATCPLGKSVCRRLLDMGARVAALRRGRTGERDDGASQVRWIEGMCEEPERYEALVHSSEFVVHIAGMRMASWIVRACAGHTRLERVVFVGSTRVHYPEHLLTAGERRANGVLVAEESSVVESLLPWTVLRPSLIYGPGDRSLSRVMARVRRGGFLPMPGRGTATKQPVSARDLAESLIRAMVAPKTQRNAYDLPGPDITVAGMIDVIADVLGRRVVRVPVPQTGVRALRASAGAVGWLGLSAAATRFLRWYEDLCFSGDAARLDFGHAPRDFLTNMRELVAGYEGGMKR